MIKNKIYPLFLLVLIIAIHTCSFRITNAANQNDDREKAGEPKINFEEDSYDFGKIYSGESVQCTFKFKNVGNAELIVHNVKTSCGCTAAITSKKSLAKSEEGEISVTFKSGRNVGEIRKSIYVFSNDKKNPKYKLGISATIIEEVSIKPKWINFGIINKGDTSSRNIDIETVPDLKIKIEKIVTSLPYVQIEKNKEENDHKFSYKAVVNASDYIGKLNGNISVYTSSSKQEKINIPFTGEVIGDITYYPKRISFGRLKRNQNIKKTIIITLVKENVKIKNIEVTPGIFDYKISQLNDKSKKIDVKLKEENDIKEKFTGNITIYTNSAIQPEITVPIIGIIRD